MPITSTAIVDIMNNIAKAIVSGGHRRSSQISFGDINDLDFLDLKNPIKFQEELKSYRYSSNNSIYASIGMDYSAVAEKIILNGEPGLIWLDNMKHYGRMKDGYGDHDPDVVLCNPCAEISLENKELCNLNDIFLNRISSKEEFFRVLKYNYLYSKTVTLIPTHRPEVNAVIGRNRRIGTGITGVSQGIQKFGYRNLINMLDEGYLYLSKLDRDYSRWLCIPESIKKTTIKPGGSLPLLAGATPGVKRSEAELHIRRMRFNGESPLVKILERAGYHIEPSEQEDNTVVVDFPIKQEFFDKTEDETSMWEKLALVRDMQYYWADNQVSATIKFRNNEAKDIPRALEVFETKLKGISFLPETHGYAQAPYEAITKEQYEEMMSHIQWSPQKIMKEVSKKVEKDQEEKYCDGETCQLK